MQKGNEKETENNISSTTEVHDHLSKNKKQCRGALMLKKHNAFGSRALYNRNFKFQIDKSQYYKIRAKSSKECIQRLRKWVVNGNNSPP